MATGHEGQDDEDDEDEDASWQKIKGFQADEDLRTWSPSAIAHSRLLSGFN